MRFAIAFVFAALALAGAAAAALVGAGNPRGQWQSPGAVAIFIAQQQLGVGECSGGICKTGRPPGKPGVVSESPARILHLNLRGIGPSKLVGGTRNYRLFEVRACTLDRGAHKYSVHFRWFTRRAAGGTTTGADRDGKIVVGRDTGAPYARDWNYPRFGPVAIGRC